MKKVLTEVSKCLGCHSCENACAAVHSEAGSFLGAVLGGERPRSAVRVLVGTGGAKLPLRCQHCAVPACVDVCPTGAMQKDPETGAVFCDTEQCVGCLLCVDACPFTAIVVDDDKPFKCDLCRGREDGPACASACPTGALRFDEADAGEIPAMERQILDILKGAK